ncbi:hypothetical protein HPB52_015684 [Rhipicephalus sanguineus]|uniref:Uncharacterized protein n=1 Tax=Rhipicephalus sanguineus TaxID=34632 RepID=A0A9D4SYR1_RHISA|nr:hypothetical protein HPB52_015684 [Rhipicephalus sanguineus]
MAAQAWQPQFDPPLPPFCAACIKSWFAEFEAALELNSIWLEEIMFEVLQYVLPPDLKRRLTYFSTGPRPYDELSDAILQFYGVKRWPCQETARTIRALSPLPISTLSLPPGWSRAPAILHLATTTR